MSPAYTNSISACTLRHCSRSLRRELHTHRLVTKASSNPNNLLHDIVEGSVSLGQQRLKSRRPFSHHAAKLRGSDFNICQTWRASWQETPRPAQLDIMPNTTVPPGANLPRRGVGVIEPDPHRSRSIQRSHAPVGAASISSLPVWRTRTDCSTHLE